MEISGNTTISYLPVRDVSARTSGAAETPDQPRRELPRGVASLDSSLSSSLTARNARQPAEGESVGNKVGNKPASQPVQDSAPNAGVRFEYENKTQVMKVSDNKGILIYQVPSKGQLALIADQDSGEPSRLAQTA